MKGVIHQIKKNIASPDSKGVAPDQGTSTVTKEGAGSDPDRNEDGLSLGGHDNLEDDINKLIDPQDSHPEEKEDDVLDEISVQYVAAEKLGKSIVNSHLLTHKREAK